jgi:hypothetical protein
MENSRNVPEKNDSGTNRIQLSHKLLCTYPQISENIVSEEILVIPSIL